MSECGPSPSRSIGHSHSDDSGWHWRPRSRIESLGRVAEWFKTNGSRPVHPARHFCSAVVHVDACYYRPQHRRFIMRSRVTIALYTVTAVICATAPAAAQYYEDDAPVYRRQRGDCYYGGCCPPGYTIQGGECRPYRGPRGYGNGYQQRGYYQQRYRAGGCPPGYSWQSGACKPYRGP
jgi:hypothetical protein